ncbi:MAG: rhodanese-related sulfurtransferase [Hyphomicrobiales bacterium]|nr:rhodanese-related sulfurtransferase [Hyphomicrobiales bacterium]
MSGVIVAGFYKFTPMEDPAAVKARIQPTLEQSGLYGTLILAREGLNGTLAGTRDGMNAALSALRALPGCGDLAVRLTPSAEQPFHRLKIRIKAEIVTIGDTAIDPTVAVGDYVAPSNWNALLRDPDVAVIDTRNAYEARVGGFEGAIDPGLASFREFPQWFARFAAERRPQKVAMFCTGGIRCEKATALAKAMLPDAEVYHLKGGILDYLDEIAPEDSLWRGECFVFDHRAAVTHGGAQGAHSLCFACREPVSEADRASPLYSPGVSCPRCHGSRSPERIAGFRERRRQMALAKSRGARHIGARQGVIES